MGNRPGYVKAQASQSFNQEEVELLDQFFTIARRGGDVAVLARHRSFKSVCRKVQAMKRRVKELEAKRAELGLSSIETGEDQ